jgi:hypothetical protein
VALESGAVQGSPLRSDHALRAWLARCHRRFTLVMLVAGREALTTPLTERVTSGNYVMAAQNSMLGALTRAVAAVMIEAMLASAGVLHRDQATANSKSSDIRRESAYSMWSTRR